MEIGSIHTGKVTKITKFSAFVTLENNEYGIVHISEVASDFVEDINDFLVIGQEVSVKVLRNEGKGKVSFSIKKAAPPSETAQPSRAAPPSGRKPDARFSDAHRSQPTATFEDKLKTFMTESELKGSARKDKHSKRRR